MDLVEWIEVNRKTFTDLSDAVWGFAELGYKEVRSSRLLSHAFEEAGFILEKCVAEIPTAFMARHTQGAGPVIAILGEFDALPGLSQDCVPYRKPLVDGAPGHGCGHNLLGVAGLATCLALQRALQAGDAAGTVRYYGCPAEEGGAAKAFMAKAGLFDDVAICLTWHPDAFNGTLWANFLANYRVGFKFHGRPAHAAADPYNGRSALDAVELMNVGVNYLREHMIPDARIHYVITNGGGSAPNVVPAEAASLYSVRAPRTDQLNPLFERVKNIARGAALMTGTELDIELYSGMSNLLLNETINTVLQRKLEEVGAPKFSQADWAFAAEIAKTIPAGSLEESARAYGLDSEAVAVLKNTLLYEGVLPPYKSDIVQPGSTDVGDVSWRAPTGQIVTACMALGTPGHSWQTVAQARMGIGHKGMLYAGQVMARTALEFLRHPELVGKARDEYQRRRAASDYTSPIPDGLKPPIDV
ncbi:MAG TPA: amidohydrolase [Anaerolineales bacterium]|nr:amidohydrolase [Anaerolineales bacterium]